MDKLRGENKEVKRKVKEIERIINGPMGEEAQANLPCDFQPFWEDIMTDEILANLLAPKALANFGTRLAWYRADIIKVLKESVPSHGGANTARSSTTMAMTTKDSITFDNLESGGGERLKNHIKMIREEKRPAKVAMIEDECAEISEVEDKPAIRSLSHEMDTLFTCMLFFLFTILIVKAITSVLIQNSSKENHKLPPGPSGLPIIGNLLQLGAKPHETLATLASTLGPIMSLKLGQITTIVMSSVEMAKEVLQIHDQFLSNRMIPDAMKDANEGLRRKKVQELLSDIHQSSLRGEAVDIGRLAFKTTINLLSNTLYSEDLVHSADKTGEIKEVVENIMKEVGRPNLADCFPVLKVFDPHGIRRRTSIYFSKLLTIFKTLIDKRFELRKGVAYCTKHDILDVMLNDAQDNNQELHKDKIERLSMNLFVAGTDTTTSTVEWAMAELLRNPNIMSKANAELESTIGKGNNAEESDISRLPYLQAIVKETFRLHPAVRLLLRKAEVELKMHGYKIPKGAHVLVNVWAIGRDPNLSDNPCLFSPERFLGSEIDFRGRSFELTPFGAGRRICPGVPLAIRLLFLMLGLFINFFDWELEGGIKPHDMNMDEKFGLTLEKAQPVLAVPIKTTN
ncbi:hypothetical protein Fmac_001636 [Flemingia macrophylla]|uniref:Cytochrome P450 n=1 Tax=Flemingia macrophylla TaxID=520843 RepID=A0ABD1NHN8_9FABA